MKNKTRLLAAAVAGTVALSCASCSMLPFGGAKKEDIIEAADAFASALVKCDAGKIAKLTNEDKDSDAVAKLEEHLGGTYYSEDQYEVAEAIAKTITYEIDEESIETGKDEAEATVVFTMVDYDSVLDGVQFDYVTDALTAIENCKDETEVELTFEFALEDDEWLVSNLSDKSFDKFYSFYGYDLDIIPDLTALVDAWYTSKTATYLTLEVEFCEDVSEYVDDMTYTVWQDNYIAMEATPYYKDMVVFCDFSVDGPLEPGTYDISLMFHDQQLGYGTVVIEDNSIIGGGTGSGTGTGVNGYGTGSFTPSIDGDMYVATADATNAFVEGLEAEGYGIDFEGTLYVDIVIVLGDNGEFEFAADNSSLAANIYDFMEANIDPIMMAFLGVSSEDQLEATAESLGLDTYDTLRQTMLDALVLEFEDYDFGIYLTGTYTTDGDTIYFESNDVTNFEGVMGTDGSFTVDIGDTSGLNNNEPLVFYPAD